MRIRGILRSAVVALTIFAFALVFSTCGHKPKSASAPVLGGAMGAQPARVDVSIESALQELNALELPRDVDPEVFQQLKDELARLLEAKGASKITSTPPTGDANRVDDLAIIDDGDGTYTLSWHYRNLGDYDQNGTVAIADITPLAMYYSEERTAGEEDSLSAVIDGSGNYKVDIADVTPIAMNFGTEVAKYSIEASETSDGIYGQVHTISLSSGLDADMKRMHFAFSFTPTLNWWYRVVPSDSDDNHAEASNAAQCSLSWVHTWGGNSVEEAAALSVDSNGNVYIAGNCYSFGAGYYDTFLLKYASNGTLLWQRTWGGNDGESTSGLALDSNGSIYIAGYTSSFGAGDSDTFLIKYSPTGDLLWQKTWGGSDFDDANALGVDSAGDIYIAGHTYSFGFGGGDAFLLKYSASGTLLWQRTWAKSTSPDWEWANALALDSSGGVYVAGYAEGFNCDAVLLKYSSEGNLLWQKIWRKSWSGNGYQEARAVALDNSGNVYLAGNTWPFLGLGYEDTFLLKYSSDGNLLWQSNWGGSGSDWAYALAVDVDGNVYVAGGTYSFGAGENDALLLKYSPDGSLLWQKTWGGSYSDAGHALAVDGNGLLYVAGYARQLYGVWGTITESSLSSSGAAGSINGSTTNPIGSETSPIGVESTPDGTEDRVLYDVDALVMKIDQAEW